MGRWRCDPLTVGVMETIQCPSLPKTDWITDGTWGASFSFSDYEPSQNGFMSDSLYTVYFSSKMCTSHQTSWVLVLCDLAIVILIVGWKVFGFIPITHVTMGMG